MTCLPFYLFSQTFQNKLNFIFVVISHNLQIGLTSVTAQICGHIKRSSQTKKKVIMFWDWMKYYFVESTTTYILMKLSSTTKTYLLRIYRNRIYFPWQKNIYILRKKKRLEINLTVGTSCILRQHQRSCPLAHFALLTSPFQTNLPLSPIHFLLLFTLFYSSSIFSFFPQHFNMNVSLYNPLKYS